MIEKVLSVLKAQGPSGLVRALRSRLTTPRLRCASAVKRLVAGKTGLEIGGPTALFARDGVLPLYPVLHRLDNCNFSGATIWEGKIQEGLTFKYDRRHAAGRQFILEAADLAPIADASYDCVLSSHTLEHTANPLKTLREWVRTLKDEGTLVLVLPHKEGTFDHRRPVTTMDHMIEDYRKGTTEADVTHLPEILVHHDLALDPPAGDLAAFTARSERNAENRCLHHHVFNTPRVLEMVDWAGLQLIAVEPTLPHHIFVVAQKLPHEDARQNDRFLASHASYRQFSPFAIDRLHA